MRDIGYLFPKQQRSLWTEIVKRCEEIQEIRLRVNRPVILQADGKELFVNCRGEPGNHAEKALVFGRDDIQDVLNHICQHSVYAFEEEIKKGYITAGGGHRVGLVGTVVIENGKVKTINQFSGLNIRIAHEVKGAADGILPFLYRDGQVINTLIIAPPGCGKTTLLRDIIRQVSDGNRYGRGRSVGVVDERSELAGCIRGEPQNDLGLRTDILDACPKIIGMEMMIRSMNPSVLAVDELGGSEDMKMVHRAATCGVSVIATIHGDGLEDYQKKMERNGQDDLPFSNFLVLGRSGNRFFVREMIGVNGVYAKMVGLSDDGERKSGNRDMVSGTAFGTNPGTEEALLDYGAFVRGDSLSTKNPSGLL